MIMLNHGRSISLKDDMEYNGMLLKNLANELEDLIFVLNPDRPTPIYGDISDYLARQKADAVLPVGFDTYRYMQDLYKCARQASKEIMAFAMDLKIAPAETAAKISPYFSQNDNSASNFMTIFIELINMLPDAHGASINELDPFKRAAFILNNNRKVISNIISEIEEEFGVRGNAGGLGESVVKSTPAHASVAAPASSSSQSIVKKDIVEEKYLERLYTTAEFIINTNLSPSLKRKYGNIEMFESQYSFLKKDAACEADLQKNVKQYTIKNTGAFPYITLVVFVKDFANLIQIAALSYDGQLTSPEFFEKFYTLKYKTRNFMEHILNLPKADLSGAEALAFIRTEIVPLSNIWVKEVVIPMRMGRQQYFDDINKISQFITARINKIYALEGVR